MHNKYQKLKKQYSTDGVNWYDVTPPEYKEGVMLEENSPDCGGTPTIYRWYVKEDEYVCEGYNKYEKLVYQQSTDNGITWEDVVPEQTATGSLIESNSIDCDYGITWEVVDEEYICINKPFIGSFTYTTQGNIDGYENSYVVSLAAPSYTEKLSSFNGTINLETFYERFINNAKDLGYSDKNIILQELGIGLDKPYPSNLRWGLRTLTANNVKITETLLYSTAMPSGLKIQRIELVNPEDIYMYTFNLSCYLVLRTNKTRYIMKGKYFYGFFAYYDFDINNTSVRDYTFDFSNMETASNIQQLSIGVSQSNYLDDSYKNDKTCTINIILPKNYPTNNLEYYVSASGPGTLNIYSSDNILLKTITYN